MAYITKTDIKVLFDLGWSICKWALKGFNPMVPEVEEEDKLEPTSPNPREVKTCKQ